MKVCPDCRARLVESEHEADRGRHRRLLWQGISAKHFDAIDAALFELNVARRAVGSSGLTHRFHPRYEIWVLDEEFTRALAAGTSAVTSSSTPSEWETCPSCHDLLPGGFSRCSKCGTLLLKPQGMSDEPIATRVPDAPEVKPPGAMGCPMCRRLFAEHFSRCSECGISLQSNVLPPRPASQEEIEEPIWLIWRGGDPVAFSRVVASLRAQAIRHFVKPTHDHLAWALAIPQPRIEIYVRMRDEEPARSIASSVAERTPFEGGHLRMAGLLLFGDTVTFAILVIAIFVAWLTGGFRPIWEKVPPVVVDVEVPFDWPITLDRRPKADARRLSTKAKVQRATTEVWVGDDAACADILRSCLAENDLTVRTEGQPPGVQRLFALPQDAESAREVIRQVFPEVAGETL